MTVRVRRRVLPTVAAIVATISGTLINSRNVHAQGPAPLSDVLISRRQFQIGTGTGSTHDTIMFSSIRWVTPRKDGGAYVYDGRLERVLYFDARGTLVREIGHPGKGNGAFGELVGGATFRDSLLALWDPGAARILVFHESGVFRRNIVYEKNGRGYISRGTDLQFAADSNGLLYLQIQNSMGSDQFSWLRLKEDGTIVDSVAYTRSRSERRFTSDGMRTPFALETMRVPYRAGGVLVGDAATYQISVARGNENTPLIKQEWEAVPIVADERAEWLAFMNRGATARAATIDSVLPATKTAFRALLSDQSGHIWVERNGLARADSSANDALTSRPSSIWRDVTRYDVFDGRGTLLFQVVLPRNTYVLAVDNRRLWLHETVNGKSMIGVYDF